MSLKYKKTIWVDGETPVNAENLNKIEKAIQVLSERSVTASNFKGDEENILVETDECGNIHITLSKTPIYTETLKGIDMISSLEEAKQRDSLYFCTEDSYIDPGFNPFGKNVVLAHNGKRLFPVTLASSVFMENNESLVEYMSNENNILREEISRLLTMRDNTIQMLIERIEQLENKVGNGNV